MATNSSQFKPQPIRTASPVVREMFEIADHRGETGRTLEEKVLIHRVSISRWRHGHSCPTAVDVEEMLAGMGHKLVIVPDDCEVMLIPKKQVA